MSEKKEKTPVSSIDGQGHLWCNEGWSSGPYCDYYHMAHEECVYPTPILLLIWRFIYSAAMIFGGYKIWRFIDQPGFEE